MSFKVWHLPKEKGVQKSVLMYTVEVASLRRAEKCVDVDFRGSQPKVC